MTPRWRARFFLFAVLAMVAGPGGAASLRERDEAWNPPRIVELAEGETLPAPGEL